MLEMKMSEYESMRRRIVDENKRKMEELGLRPLAYEKMNLKKPVKQVKINKTLTPTQVFQNDDEPTLGKGDHSENLSKQDTTQGFGTILNLRSRSKKVIASENVELERIADKQQLSMATMASIMKSRSQTQKRLLEQSKAKNQCDGGALQLKQPPPVLAPPLQELPPKQAEDNSHGKTQARMKKSQNKMMISPGTLSAFLRLRGKGIEDEGLSLPINDVNQPESLPHQGVRVELFEDDNGYEIRSSHEQQHSNDYALEENSDPIVPETNEPTLMHDHHIDQPVLEKKRRTRGPTMCKNVHAWTLDERRPIFFNVKGQPIGPDQESLTKFSMFLGTVSPDSTLAPLNKVDWRHVTGKDKIFDYVKKKFIIPDEAMEYVLSSVGNLWRSHKCRIKKKHYIGYENDKERWVNRPKSISDSHFKELLEYWKLDEVKELSKKNKEHSEGQKDRHTMGPISFARKRYELENDGKNAPSQALMYKETRKRKEGKIYMSSNEEIVPDSLKSELLGRYTKKRKQSLNCGSGGVLIPDEIMQPYRDGILKETVGEVMKLLKDHIPSEILSTITSSLKTQSFGGIKETVHCQDDNFDVDGNAERIENEDDEEGGEGEERS